MWVHSLVQGSSGSPHRGSPKGLLFVFCQNCWFPDSTTETLVGVYVLIYFIFLIKKVGVRIATTQPICACTTVFRLSPQHASDAGPYCSMKDLFSLAYAAHGLEVNVKWDGQGIS